MKSILLVCLLMFVTCCWSANILAFLPTLAKSHYMAFQPLLKELAVRGHNITVLSHFSLKDAPSNYNHIDVSIKDSNTNSNYIIYLLNK